MNRLSMSAGQVWNRCIGARARRLTASVLIFTIALVLSGTAGAAEPTVSELVDRGDLSITSDDGYLQSLQRAVALYKQAATVDPQDPLPHLRLARAYLDLGDGVEGSGFSWYQLGEQAAKSALAVKEDSADGHYYFAANHGHVMDDLPFWKVSPATPANLERHLRRALELQPDHPRALHMMGMLLWKVPAPLRLFMTGEKSDVVQYLTRAVAADPNYAVLRWDLAKYYRSTNQPSKAAEQARAILSLNEPTDAWAWRQKYRPRAEELLEELDTR